MDLKCLIDPAINLIKFVTPFIVEYAKEEVDYQVNYEKNVEELERVAEELRQEGNRVRDKVAEEQWRRGGEIDKDAIYWLKHVDDIITEYDKFKEEEDREHARCCLGRVPLIRRRGCCCRRKIEEMVEEVEQLQSEKHHIIWWWQDAPFMGNPFSNADYRSFDSRTEAMHKIMEALQDSRTRMIGVHGPTGVGKTTLVREAVKISLKEKLFDVMIMVNMTSPNIREIQGQIADMLGMKLEEENEHARAIRIQERLKKEKDNILIIIDDLWAKVDLHMLGIPSEIPDDGDDSEKIKLNLKEGRSAIKTEKTSGGSSELKTEERYRGCKILLISEARQVLSQMDVEASLIFSVNVLNGKEAETLFKRRAGVRNRNSEFGKLAAEIAKKCNGLPMSIVTTARALKYQSLTVWEVTNQELESQKLTAGTLEYSTKLSYKLLENEELKITFLLCARMGHDALVMDLVKYCIGLGFLQGISTVREARNRVQAMLVKLKLSGLLSDSYSSDHFTMQNFVCSAALSIASEESHMFMLTKGKLEEWPDEDELERYTGIYLRHCDIIEKFPESLNCPRLRVFHLDNNDPCLAIPDNFFQQMKELKVLILTGFCLSPLPLSIRCLTKLRMLCLEQCTLGEQLLCIIGELTNLRILSFSGSDIYCLPVELKHLSKLQIFDVSNCSKLREVPPNVISSMTSLEELYMGNTPIQWRLDEGRENQSENASLLELGYLNQLKTLDILIPTVAYFPNNLFFDKLSSYKIVIGTLTRCLELGFNMPEKHELSRFLAIQQKDGFDIHSQTGIKMQFERVEILLLENFNGAQDIIYALNLKGFQSLKHLSIVSNSDLHSLINPKKRNHPVEAFPKLESLDLYKLKNMKEICSSSCLLSAPSFSKLQSIKIELCGQLKNVFLISIVRLLTKLETIKVSKCNLLKEIVPKETQGNVDEVELKFPELRSLTLQSLPELIGFYPISPAGGTRILFHKKVVVSKLERLELSSIQIDQIWIDQYSHFQNLIHLDVNCCSNLKNLLSFSMAKNLVILQSLFVSECEKMEHLFSQGQDNDANMKLDWIFPNLKNIKLSSMKSLSEIWNFEFPAGSFGKLDTLIIEKCDKFVNVFPCYMEGIFQRLSTLRVTNCRSMKTIFDLADKKGDAGSTANLQDVHLETLPKLEHVVKWRKDRAGILDLKNVQKIWVQDCDKLENIFPVSVARTLENLDYLVVWDCCQLREIVAKGEDANNTSSPIEFKFPRLTTVKFLELPKFKSFYPEAYELNCPLLNELSVELCDKLELFREETADAPFREETTNPPFREETAYAQGKPILFPEEVINNLKSMQIEPHHANWQTKYDYQGNNLEDLCLSRLKNIDILYYFLHQNPNIKNIWLHDCSFEELVPLKRPPEIESLGVVPKLKSLKLINLPYLWKIGFERNAILQRIEFLILKNCPSLYIVAASLVSLSHLINLEVVDCKELKYLMPPSTAKSLVQLRTMKLIDCESLEEIVSEQQSEEEAAARELTEEGENAVKVDIVFRQLKALELVSLKNLKSFCSSRSCVFEFPSLEKVVVSACPKMENFCQSFPQEIRSTPMLQKVYVVHENEERWCWEGNLQDTIQYMFKNKKFFEGMDRLSVSEHFDLQEVWQGKKEGLRKDWFYSLKTLKLENCQFESYAIPSNVLRSLKSLKELEVRSCNNITFIFEMNEAKIGGTSFQLKKLTLEELSDVTHVWQQDKQGIASFQNLQQMTVTDCKKLKALFPASLARNLKKLEKLEVKYCDELLDIVGKEEEAAAEWTEKFVFPGLTELELVTLPQLAHFHSERFILECPSLNVLTVTGCNKLNLLESHQEVSASIIGQPLFSDIKGISKVGSLYLNWKHTSVLRSWLGQSTDREDLQHLNEVHLCFDDAVNDTPTLPFEILEKTPNLETMIIEDCGSLKELLLEGMLGNLTDLYLCRLYDLHSIGGLEYLPKLQLVSVSQCPRLTTLVPQSVSNLRQLHIQECHRLRCLFTSSAAMMLIHLEEMYIQDCESLKEIVGEEQDEIDIEEIKFERLERISLESSSSLECFYSGNATLLLPSLIQVRILKCPKMKLFSQGSIHVEFSKEIQVSYDDSNDDLVFHCDLNVAVERQFLHQTSLVLGDYPELEEKWLGLVPLSDV